MKTKEEKDKEYNQLIENEINLLISETLKEVSHEELGKILFPEDVYWDKDITVDQ